MTTLVNCPLVSILIPSYNSAAFVAETVDSVLAQSYPNIEIIVVDDGSTDDSVKILQQYGNRITLIPQANGGLASARNRGLRAASGEFLALLDADDICEPGRLAAQVACLQQCPDAVLCCTDFAAYSDGKILEPSHIATYYRLVASTEGGISGLLPGRLVLEVPQETWPAGQAIDRIPILFGRVDHILPWGNFIHPPTVMIRRSAVAVAGEFDEGIRNGTDYDWLLRMAAAGPVAYLDRALLKYRYSEAQLSSPRNTARLALDSIIALRKLARRDADFIRRHWLRFLRRIGNCQLQAADALLESNRFKAAGLLAGSVLHGTINLTTIKVAVKLVLPRGLLAWRRRHRRTLATDLHGRRQP